jgi:formamidase
MEQGALAGRLTGDEFAKVARDGARTVPGRENGGNQDIKNLTRGSRVFFPVHVPGAKLSAGDLHFSQGDGEITFCGAIEMGGFLDLGVDLIKGGMQKYGVTTNPIFMPGRVEPKYTEFMSFVGVSVDHETNTNFYMDATVAYRRACLNAIEYLKTFGYSGEQAYLLLGSAPIEGRISGIVDIPNACCSLYLPTAIFDFDVRPTAEGPRRADRGKCAVTS